MKTELDLLRALVPVFKPVPVTVRLECRKEFNLAMGELTHDGLLKEDRSLETLARHLITLMSAMTKTLLTLDLDPTAEDFIYACCQTASYLRKDFDDALKMDNVADVRIASVMVEIFVKGVCTALALPYDELLRAAAKEMRDAQS